jgi:hypothetical protein
VLRINNMRRCQRFGGRFVRALRPLMVGNAVIGAAVFATMRQIGLR